jgi:hypothetical protein
MREFPLTVVDSGDCGGIGGLFVGWPVASLAAAGLAINMSVEAGGAGEDMRVTLVGGVVTGLSTARSLSSSSADSNRNEFSSSSEVVAKSSNTGRSWNNKIAY